MSCAFIHGFGFQGVCILTDDAQYIYPFPVGGSLMVQILGSSSSSSPSEGEERKESGRVFVSDEKGGLSVSPIVVNSRKDVPDILKK